jgi:hypothetical protein
MVTHNNKYNRHLANKQLKTQRIRATSNNISQADKKHQEFIEQVKSNSRAPEALKQLAIAVTIDVLNHGFQIIGMLPGVAEDDKKFANLFNDSINQLKTAENPLFPIKGDEISKWHTKDLLQRWGTNPKVQNAIISSIKNTFESVKDRVKPYIKNENAGTSVKENFGKHTKKVIEERKPALKDRAGQNPH